MSRFFLAFFLTASIGFIGGAYLPWWSIALAGFLAGLLIKQSALLSFLSAFSGIFILWIILCAWIDSSNESILSTRVSNLLPLGGSTIMLILASSLIGGLVSGMASMTARFLMRDIVRTGIEKRVSQ